VPLATSNGRDEYGDDEDYGSLDDIENLELAAPFYRANFSGYDCVDPFGITPVQLSPTIHAILQYTLQIYSYSGNNYKLAFLPTHVQSTISRFPIGAVVQRCVYKPHHLYSVMAGMAARLKHVFATSPAGQDPLTLRNMAYRYLRKELVASARSGVVDKQTILDILFLVVSELQYGLYEEARAHLRLVDRLYHLLDLNEYLDRWISETTAHIDNQLALSTATRPIVQKTFDPGIMLPERMATLRREAQRLKDYASADPTKFIMHSEPKPCLGLTDAMSDFATTIDLRMGSRFTEGLKVGAFPGKFGLIIADLVDCIEIAKVVWLSPLAMCFDAEWLCRKARAVLRALLVLAPENYVGPRDVISNCHECARMSLVILMAYACTLTGPQTAKANVVRFQRTMDTALYQWCANVGWAADGSPLRSNSRLNAWHEMQAGFVLWSLFTGLWTAQGQPEEEWFTTRTVNLCRYFGYSTYNDLHNHLAQYLYSKTLQGPSLHKIALRLQGVRLNPRGASGRLA
jgi:hypothetical protein